HRLDEIFDRVQATRDDAPAQGLEAPDVERNVVVDQENGLGASTSRVRNIGENPLDRVRVEVAPAHFNDRTETAVEGAAARGFNHVDLAAEKGGTVQPAGRASRPHDPL